RIRRAIVFQAAFVIVVATFLDAGVVTGTPGHAEVADFPAEGQVRTQAEVAAKAVEDLLFGIVVGGLQNVLGDVRVLQVGIERTPAVGLETVGNVEIVAGGFDVTGVTAAV